METKVCKQCGEIKPIELFRQYYGGRKGRYTICATCEKINSREKYLSRKSSNDVGLTSDEALELSKIHALWDCQAKLGLRPPRRVSGMATPLNIDTMLATYEKKTKLAMSVVATVPDTLAVIPQDLTDWLQCRLTAAPEYYQDEIYEMLKSKYRPVLFIDQGTLLPVYDDRYREVLNAIAARFDDYEDNYDYDKK